MFFITTTTTSPNKELRESVIFQPVLQAYPTQQSWIISAHVSLNHLKCHWKAFTKQLPKTEQLLQFLSHQASAPTQMISVSQLEFTNIEDIYNSYKPTIMSAVQLLNNDPSFHRKPQSHSRNRRSLLPFLWQHTQMAYGLSHNSGHKYHQDPDKSAFHHSNKATRNPCSHSFNTKHHMIHNPD